MQLLYFCLLLSAVATPIMPVLFQDALLRSIVLALLQYFPDEFRDFRPSLVSPIQSTVGMLVLVSVYGIFSKCIEARRNADLERGVSPRQLAESHLIQKRLLQWSWIFVSPVFLSVIGWGGMPQKLSAGVDSLAWSLAIWMLPSLLMVVLIDSQSHRWRNLLVARVAAGRNDPNLENWMKTFWSHARHTWLMIFAMPLVTCLAIDIAMATSISWEFSTSLKSVVCFLVMIPLVFVAPYLMLWCWSTEELEGVDDHLSTISIARVEWIKSLWAEHVPWSPRVLYWATNHRFACAMVVGWVPPMRCLVISDSLLQKLTDQQLRMVILHEAAHVRRWHVWFRFAPVVVGTIFLSLWFQPTTYTFILEKVPVYAIWMHGLATVGGILILIRCISLVGKWTELDADRVAIQLDSMPHSMPKSKAERLELLQLNSTKEITQNHDQNLNEATSGDQLRPSGRRWESSAAMILALQRIVPETLHQSGGWLHPSVETRRLRIEQRYFIDTRSMVESCELTSKSVATSSVDTREISSFSAPNNIVLPAGN